MTITPNIQGYKALDPAQVAQVNQNKALEELLARQVDNLRQQGGIDQRLLSIAATHFLEGFMSLNRAITQPGRIDGAIDISKLAHLFAEKPAPSVTSIIASGSISATDIAKLRVSGHVGGIVSSPAGEATAHSVSKISAALRAAPTEYEGSK